MISVDDIDFKWMNHLAMRNQYSTLRRDNNLGLQWESFTNRDPQGFAKGKAKNYFFIDNDEREFHNLEDLINAYNEKFKFSEENPEHEVVYVKLIKKREIKLQDNE